MNMLKKYKSINTNVLLEDINFLQSFEKKRNNIEIYNNNIMCFDVETSSGFCTKNGQEVIKFDKEKKPEYWDEYEKVSVVYIWQFCIDGNVYVGRTIDELRDFLDALDKVEPHKKIVYIHNASFEFQTILRDLFYDNFTNVLSRKKRKVIYCEAGLYQFRCSYMLVHLSLDNWGKEKNLNVKKLSGTLDYNVIRTPKTKLTDEELQYCINDVLTMCEGLKEYKQLYGYMNNIPLTQTGELRRELQNKMNVKNEYKYRRKMVELIPRTLDEYRRLVSVFSGGATVASYRYYNRTIKNTVYGYDIASSYPYIMCTCKFPMTHFIRGEYSEKFNTSKYSYIIEFIAQDIISNLYIMYWSVSKTLHYKNARTFNGRIISADYVHVRMTNLDFNTFKKAYSIGTIQIIDFWYAINNYLSPTFVKYLLELYENKTKLKGIEDQKALYMKSKEKINASYGCSVYREIADEVFFKNGEWGISVLDEKLFYTKIAYLKKRVSKTFTAYQHGIFVTANARYRFWDAVISNNENFIYGDTDSIYTLSPNTEYFNEQNEIVEEIENKTAERLGVSADLFAPVDKKGNIRRMGIWENEHDDTHDTISEFKTCGAKKYIYRMVDGLHMTVAGVRKAAVNQIDDIDKFDDSLVFDVDHAKKNILHYNDDMPVCIWNKGKYDEWTSNQKFGICLQPTTYSLGLTVEGIVNKLNGMPHDTEILKEE